MDSVADALIRIKNSYLAHKPAVSLKYSKLIYNLMKLLQTEGYLEGVSTKEREVIVKLLYLDRKPAITNIKRVSKPSLRVYKGVADLPSVLNGLGIAIISTPKGLMTDKAARKCKVGGEVLALVW